MTSHTSSEYKQLYQYLLNKHQYAQAASVQLDAQNDHLEQCTRLMQLRISTMVDLLNKANKFTNESLIPTTSLDDVIKLESHAESLNSLSILSQIEKTVDIDQALDLVPQSLSDWSQLPKTLNVPEISHVWSAHGNDESMKSLLSKLKVNTNFNNDITSYNDLKRKLNNYKTSEYVLLGLNNQEIESKKRRKLATTNTTAPKSSITTIDDEPVNSSIFIKEELADATDD